MDSKESALFEYRDRIANYFKGSINGSTILDIGCGDGYLWTHNLFGLQSKKVVGVDIDFHKKWQKIRDKNMNFIVCDAMYLPFKKSSFDTVFEKDAIHHIKDKRIAITEMLRVSTNTIILVEANRNNPLSYFHMVFLRKHDHLSQKKFFQYIYSVAPNTIIKFSSLEAHYFGLNSSFLNRFLNITQNIFGKILPKILLSYNIAIIKKK